MVPAFIKAGVKGIVLLASNAEKLAATEKKVKEINPSIETLTYPLDISDSKAVETAFTKIKEKFGHADVLINAAGAMTGDGPKLHDTDPDEWWRNFVGLTHPSFARKTCSKHRAITNTPVVGDQRKRKLSAHPLLLASLTKPRYTRYHCQRKLMAGLLHRPTSRRLLYEQVYP